MISFSTLFEYGPPNYPPYYQQPMPLLSQQPPEKKNFIQKIKDGYNNINNKYESFVDTAKNVGLQAAPLVGGALMTGGLISGNQAIRNVGMGMNIVGTAANLARVANAGKQQYRQRVEGTYQQP